jgi:hypothetical protein
MSLSCPDRMAALLPLPITGSGEGTVPLPAANSPPDRAFSVNRSRASEAGTSDPHCSMVALPGIPSYSLPFGRLPDDPTLVSHLSSPASRFEIVIHAPAPDLKPYEEDLNRMLKRLRELQDHAEPIGNRGEPLAGHVSNPGESPASSLTTTTPSRRIGVNSLLN